MQEGFLFLEGLLPPNRVNIEMRRVLVFEICHVFSSLHFAIVTNVIYSSYWNIKLKPKQVQCLKAIYSGKDTISVLPTRYGKSIIFHHLPGLF